MEKDLMAIIEAFWDGVQIKEEEEERIDNALDYTRKTNQPGDEIKETPSKIATWEMEVLLEEGKSVDDAMRAANEKYKRAKEEEKTEGNNDETGQEEAGEKPNEGMGEEENKSEEEKKEEAKEKIQELKEEAKEQWDEMTVEELEQLEDDLELGLDPDVVFKQLDSLREELLESQFNERKATKEADFYRQKAEEYSNRIMELEDELKKTKAYSAVADKYPEVQEVVIAFKWGRKDRIIDALDKLVKKETGLSLKEMIDENAKRQEGFARWGWEGGGIPKAVDKSFLSTLEAFKL